MIASHGGADVPTRPTEGHEGHRCSAACQGVFDDFTFALCLTHDVDRVYKTFQAPYYSLREGRLHHLRDLVSTDTPYWQFDEVMAIEKRHDVRSTFFFLDEQHLFRDKSPRRWLSPTAWSRYLGHYDLADEAIAQVIRTLDDGGWEVGLHGSFDSYRDPTRLDHEKRTLESVLGHAVTGCRQHYLNLTIPDTWRFHRSIGLRYDASLGSSTAFGFDASNQVDHRLGTGVRRPFDDDFLVFPLTVMETALVEPAADPEAAWEALEALLQEARRHRAVVSVLWHPRLFHTDDFPGYRDLYDRLIPRAKALGAWVGPLEDAYREITRGCELYRE
ncbi:MAG: polysaccharide deacetylase family protein [Halobacteriota archaeon]